jgi:hypothetical protein
MVGAFALYVVMHSPLRDLIAASLGLRSRVCYFVCGETGVGQSSAAAWVLIACALGAAWVTAAWFGHREERLLAFGLLALAFVSVPAAAIGGVATWTGTVLLRPPAGPLLAAVPAAFAIGFGLLRGWRPARHVMSAPAVPLLVLAVGSVAGMLLLTVVALSLTFPPTGYDALSYHAPLALFLWREGNLTSFLDRAPDVYTLTMPGTVQLWYGLLRVAGGERLADLGQLPFLLLGGVAAAAFAGRLGLRGGTRWLAAAAFLIAPSILMQAGIQVADVAGAALLMATIALASGSGASWTASRCGLVGLGLGLAATTKLALLPGVAGVMLVAITTVLLQARRSRGTRPTLVRLGALGLAFLAVAAPWWARNAARYGNPVYPAGIPLIGRGIFLSSHVPRIDAEFVPGAAAWPLYPLLERHSERSGLGPLFLLALVGVVAALRRARRRPLLLYLVLTLFTLVFWWAMTNHDARFLFALFGLTFAFLPFSLLALRRHQRRIGGGVIVAAAIFSALVTFDQVLFPLTRQPMGRAEFYDHVWGVDPRVSTLPEREGLLVQTGYASFTYPAFYPLLGDSLGRLVLSVDVGIGADSIVSRMRRTGVRYAYVAAAPNARAEIESLYDARRFELVHLSVVEQGWRAGTRRYLFRLR